jgi:hypothetical protein
MQGLVYDCIDDDIELPEFNHPTGTKYYAGIDWGHNDPFVLVVRAVTPQGFHVQLSETYKTGLTPSEVVEICQAKHALYEFKMAYCDPSQPGMIKELQRAGVPAIGANNDILVGIGAQYELIKTGRYKILKGTGPYTLDEFNTYHYPEPTDLKPDQDAKPDKPVDQHNHCMDANRYVSIHTRDIHKKKAPHVPTEKKNRHEMPYEYAKRIRRWKTKNYEVWS